MSIFKIAERVSCIIKYERCDFFRGIFFMLLTIHLTVGIVTLCFAQHEIEGFITAGSVDNQVRIAVLNSDKHLPIKNLTLSVYGEPRWITNMRIEADGTDDLPPEESRVFTIRFDARADVQAGVTETVVFKVSADMIAIDYPDPKMTVRFDSSGIHPIESVVRACPLKADAPDKFPMERAEAYCALDAAALNEYDRIVVFFTPQRDLGEDYREEFRYRLRDGAGKKISGGDWKQVAPGEQNPAAPLRTVRGSPGRLVVSHVIPLNIHEPGTFVLETVRLKRSAGAGLMGQGQGHVEAGEWREEGRFEVREGLIYFQGFIAEPVENLPMPRKATGVTRWSGVSNIERLAVNHEKATAAMELSARYTPATKDRDGKLKPVNKEWTGVTLLSVVYPRTIRLGRSKVIRDGRGKVTGKENVAEIEVEWIVKGDARHTPNFLPPTPIRQAPPSREAFESKARTKLLRDMFWPHTIGLDHWLPEHGKRSVFAINEVFPSEVIGDPPLALAEHFRNPETLWVLPVRLVHSDDVKVYAYAIYKSRPGRYDGPLPSPQPDSGSVGQVTGTTATDRPPAPSSPAVLNPESDANVAALIRDWISTARPPENAVEGNNVRYSNKGNVIGTVRGGVIESRHETGGIDPVYLWTNKRQLDSIDHCTLEEYVIAKLEQKAISQCAGRYGAVKDLRGMRLTEAKAAVSGAGFGYSLAPGSPARTPQQEGAIEWQEPGPDKYLRKGQTLKLTVHSPYVPPGVILPDFTGQSLSEARKWLASNKLQASLQPGSPAPTAAKSATIEKQGTAPGIQVKAGDTVTLTVHSQYVDLRKVPNVVGLKAENAERSIAATGLTAVIQPGGAPSIREQSGTVERQNPDPGTEVAAGSEVSLFIQGPFVETMVVPDVGGISYPDSKRKLDSAGLTIDRRDAGRPAERRFAETAQKQEPAAGTRVSKGSAVSVWVYGQYIPTREEQVAATDCSRFPGSRAYWDNNAGKPLCGCFDGLQWNLTNTQCVTANVRENELCAREGQGLIAQGRTAQGKINCVCPEGLTWNASQRACEKLIPARRVLLPQLSRQCTHGKRCQRQCKL